MSTPPAASRVSPDSNTKSKDNKRRLYTYKTNGPTYNLRICPGPDSSSFGLDIGPLEHVQGWVSDDTGDGPRTRRDTETEGVQSYPYWSTP